MEICRLAEMAGLVMQNRRPGSEPLHPDLKNHLSESHSLIRGPWWPWVIE